MSWLQYRVHISTSSNSMKRLYLIQIIVLTILRTFSTTVSTSLEFPFFDVTSRGVSPLGNVSSLRNSTLQQCTFPNSAIVAPRRPITFPMAYCGTTIRTCVPFDGSSITCCWIKQRYDTSCGQEIQNGNWDFWRLRRGPSLWWTGGMWIAIDSPSLL